ncbi:hypothetical protein HD806DRAFT_500005 [Xylariaceae sp. AK1471]|nr:hypothetical protein HD806DRAFT_500005 [Xylariaceae sp. AK1471]
MEQTVQEPNEVHASPRPIDSSRVSPAPQKRPRDYGEELKGLSSSGDEGSPREKSTPVIKRQRTRYNTGTGASNGSDSESLDDGEIVESPPPSHITQPINSGPSAQPAVQPLASDMIKASSHVSSEDGEIISPLGVTDDAKLNWEINGLETPRESQGPGNTSATAIDGPQASVPGWNHGIQLGTRTTFGAKPANSFFETSSTAVETTDETQDPQIKKERKRIRPRDPVTSFEASNATWNFPLHTVPEIAAPTDASGQASFWATLLKTWIVHLVQANRDAADSLTYKVVRAGWALYFTKRMGFLRGTKKEINAARLVAQDFMASFNKDSIGAMISDARQKDSADQPVDQPDDDIQVDNDHISLSSSPQANHDDEFRLQTKYFPGAGDPSQYCLSCSSVGHTTQVCPELSCRFCESGSHNSFGCPTKQRCDKCRQTGHSVDICQEKLALAPEELGGCAFCGAEHQDQDCPEIWRSFRPSELNVKKVKSIPAFCYLCGGENHYGPECSLPDKSGKVLDRTTWSKTNREIYVDPESEDVAIAWTNVDLSQLASEVPGEFHIRGRATRKTHTYFVSSDESEEDLIHAPVKKPQPRGEIRIASNIGAMGRGGNGNSRGRGNAQNDSRGWQPPLPPGPPPPLAENGTRKSFRPAPSGTLPPRPQTFAHGRPSGGSNTGPRGRGGYRGRGRGRGRGK